MDKNQSLAISDISVIDVDAGNSTLQVSLSAQQGVLTVGSTAGLQFITGDGSADSQLVFMGTLTNLNAALGGLVYQPAQDFHGGETIQLSVNDQGNTGIGGAKTTGTTLGVTVNNVNTPPVAVADRYIVPPERDVAGRHYQVSLLMITMTTARPSYLLSLPALSREFSTWQPMVLLPTHAMPMDRLTDHQVKASAWNNRMSSPTRYPTEMRPARWSR